MTITSLHQVQLFKCPDDRKLRDCRACRHCERLIRFMMVGIQEEWPLVVHLLNNKSAFLEHFINQDNLKAILHGPWNIIIWSWLKLYGQISKRLWNINLGDTCSWKGSWKKKLEMNEVGKFGLKLECWKFRAEVWKYNWSLKVTDKVGESNRSWKVENQKGNAWINLMRLKVPTWNKSCIINRLQFPTETKLSNFARFFPTLLGSFQLCSVLRIPKKYPKN